MRFSFTLILLLLSSVFLVKAQNNTSESQSEDEDRKRLENQFKALKNFYINDQGLVVYQTQSNDAKIVEDYNEYTASHASDTLVVFVEEFTTPDSISENSQASENSYAGGSETTTTSQEYYNTSSSSPATSSGMTSVVSISKRPINPASYTVSSTPAPTELVDAPAPSEMSSNEASAPESVTKGIKPVTRPTINAYSSQPASVPSATSKVATKSSVAEKANVSPDTNKAEEVVTAEAKKAKPTTTSSKKSVFQKDPSIYDSLEEAAIVTQELLEKLKSGQTGTKSSGSLSSRLSKGAGNSSLRKGQPSAGDSFASGRLGNRPVISEKTVEAERKYEEASTPYTVEPTPTYYINGVEVDKTVVDKLRKADILSREVRSRNTQSGNPAGEVWIQLK